MSLGEAVDGQDGADSRMLGIPQALVSGLPRLNVGQPNRQVALANLLHLLAVVTNWKVASMGISQYFTQEVCQFPLRLRDCLHLLELGKDPNQGLD